MLALLFLACGVVVEGTDVKFTPGPGLKKNEDGSYSRSLNKEYLESVAAGEDQIPEPGSSLRNLGITIILAGAVFLYANRHAVVDAATKIKPPSTAAAPKKLSEAEIAEARAARLARFTGDGPAKADAAMQEALLSDANGSQQTTASIQSSTAKQSTFGKATIATLHNDEKKPDEFFGGDSTNTQW